MQRLIIEAGKATPRVDCDPLQGSLEIAGVSIPELAEQFYEPVMKWIDTYIDTPTSHTNLTLHLHYANSPTTVLLKELLEKMRILQESGKSNVQVNWKWETGDISMHRMGMYLGKAAGIEMNLIEVDFPE